MHSIRKLFFVVVLVLADLTRCAVVETPSYEYLDPGTGKLLTCAQCPAGTHMTAHCTATGPTQCVPCQADHYTELWNYLHRCLYCKILCGESQEVERECSAVSNRVCRCKEGYYLDAEFCVEHSVCDPGHGVQTNGTSRTNTVCEKCPEDYFSDSSSALEPCMKHRECNSSEQTVLLRGSSSHNTVCGSCEDLKDGSEVNMLRTFLPGFFALHSMRVVKMKRFISRTIQQGGDRKKRHHCSDTLPRQRGPLLRQINAWLAHASEDQLRRVPEMLRASKLSSMADRLERRLREIQQHCNEMPHSALKTVV